LTLAGILVWAMAPETKDLTLAEAAGTGGTQRRASRRQPVSAGRPPAT
jgi:hypothetical protein